MTQPASPSKNPDLGRFSLFGGLAITGFIFLLQTNGATLGVGASLVGYLGMSALLVWSCLHYAIPHWASHHRILSTIGSIIVCALATWWGCSAQHGKEIRSRIFITNANLSSLIYNGKPQTPLLFSVSPPGATVELEVEPQRNAGTYRAIVTGTGDYTGKSEVEWTIKRRPVTVTAPSPSKVYDGSLLKIEEPKITGLVEGDLLFAYSSPSHVGPDVGEFPIKVDIHSGSNADNYEVKSIDGLAKIVGRDFTANGWQLTYDGLRHRPEISFVYPKDADVVIIGDEQTESGTYRATLSGRKNYQGTEKTVEWKILPVKTSLTMATVRGKDAACTGLLLPIEVKGINPTGQVFVSLFEVDNSYATINHGPLIGEKMVGTLQNGAAVVEYPLPPGNGSAHFLAQIEYPGDRNHLPFTGQITVAKPIFTLNSAVDAVHHLREALSELRQVYIADSANATSTAAFKSVVEIVTRLDKETTAADTARFELAQAYPPIEPDIDHALAGFSILRQLINASSANRNLLGRYHAELASAYSDIDITMMYLRTVRNAAKTRNKESNYGPSRLQNLPMLCRQLRTTIQAILEDMMPGETLPNNSLIIAESIGSVTAGPLQISVRNLQFVKGSRTEGRSNYATCVIEFTNTRAKGDISFAANGEPGEPNQLRCHLQAPNGTAFTASDFTGFSSVAVARDNPQPESIAWVVIHGRHVDLVPGFFSLRRAVWLGRFSTLRAGQRITATITFFPKDRADLYSDLLEGAAKLAVQFEGEIVVAGGGEPEKSCELFGAKIDKPVVHNESKRSTVK